jgi:hypothetical protein
MLYSSLIGSQRTDTNHEDSPMSRFVTGTLSQLSGNITINGHVPNYNELSVLSNMFEGSMFRRVGSIRKTGARGRGAIIWQVDTKKGMVARAATVGSKKASGLVISSTRSQALRA